MTVVSPDSRTYLDPFCGSGTVLYEAAARNRNAFGLEVNPAAWHLANLACISSLSTDKQLDLIRAVREATVITSHGMEDLFSIEDASNSIIERIKSPKTEKNLSLALSAVVLLGMGNGNIITHECISRGTFQVIGILKEMTEHKSTGLVECRLGDARKSHIASGYVDAVITSPPYINVFNYHQNYRPAAELLGWNVLEAARTEIGSNRKHRMNRFLTVIQYCLDMSQLIDEMSRVLRVDGSFTIILGRRSNVLGASFLNGHLIRSIIEASEAFGPVTNVERVFTNRFGERIYEDILISYKQREVKTDLIKARSIAQTALKNAMSSVPDGNRSVLSQALEQIDLVKPSPDFAIGIPEHFRA